MPTSLVVKLNATKEDEKKAADPFLELKASLQHQEGEITAKIERMEERILQADSRNQKDSNPTPSVFGELARQSVWSS